MVNYLATGGLGGQDLNKIVGDQQLADEWGGKYPYPRALQVLGEVNGDTYSIPWTLSTPVLFYNATLFQKAGLNPNDPPTTWAQVEQDAATIKQATGAAGIADCAAGGGSVVDWCTQSMIRSDGGDVLSFNGKQLTWTDPKTVAAVQELGTLGSSGAIGEHQRRAVDSGVRFRLAGDGAQLKRRAVGSPHRDPGARHDA